MRKTQEEVKSELIRRRDAYYKRKKIIRKRIALTCISMVAIVVIFAGIRVTPVSNLNNLSLYSVTDNTKETNVNKNDKNTDTTVSENKSNSKETDSAEEDYDEDFDNYDEYDDYNDFDEFYDDSYSGSSNGFSAGGSDNSENTKNCISIDIKSTDNNKIIRQFTDNLKIKKILNSINYMCWHSTETLGMDSPNLSGYIITLNYQSNYTESYTYYENKYYFDNYGLCYEINRESNPTLKEIIENLLPD